MLALATFGILVTGPVIIGYVPIMVVGALIFFLGIDLMREALIDTWGKVHRIEYITVSDSLITGASVGSRADPLDYSHCRDNGHLGFRHRHFCRDHTGLR